MSRVTIVYLQSWIEKSTQTFCIHSCSRGGRVGPEFTWMFFATHHLPLNTSSCTSSSSRTMPNLRPPLLCNFIVSLRSGRLWQNAIPAAKMADKQSPKRKKHAVWSLLKVACSLPTAENVALEIRTYIIYIHSFWYTCQFWRQNKHTKLRRGEQVYAFCTDVCTHVPFHDVWWEESLNFPHVIQFRIMCRYTRLFVSEAFVLQKSNQTCGVAKDKQSKMNVWILGSEVLVRSTLSRQ